MLMGAIKTLSLILIFGVKNMQRYIGENDEIYM